MTTQAETFRALMVDKTDAGRTIGFVDLVEADLMPGDVTVAVEFSTVNYKDALAITERAPIVRRWPMIPGIDFAGTVERSGHPDYRPGDRVLLNGWGVGETHYGGYAGKARVPGDWLLPLPAGLTLEQSMAIGTAGYTAMLCLLALERHGVGPESGDVLVTGATGGVGSVAVALLGRLGYRVVASTGQGAEADYLKRLGAAEIVDRNQLSGPGKPLDRERWAAAVDSVGSRTLANVLSQTLENGVVAACGLAQGMDLPATVAPFILRGVTLVGINSVRAPQPLRREAWSRLARDLDLDRLGAMATTVPLDDVVRAANDLLDGRVRGRVVVRVE